MANAQDRLTEDVHFILSECGRFHDLMLTRPPGYHETLAMVESGAMARTKSHTEEVYLERIA